MEVVRSFKENFMIFSEKSPFHLHCVRELIFGTSASDVIHMLSYDNKMKHKF